MEEIKVNEYIRTIDGKIDKIIEIENNYVLLKSKIIISEYGESHIFIKKSNIVKHSPNIIDLIKEGDIIEWELKNKGYYGINEVINRFGKIGVYATEADCIFELNMLDIKSIVTKEMIESIKYEVE